MTMTLADILKNLSDKITAIIKKDGLEVNIDIANIATLNDDDSFIQDRAAIVLSIVNVEEDRSQKNMSLYKPHVQGADSAEKYKKPAQTLVFSILFTSYNRNNTQYSDGLNKLEQVMRCLQNNNVFYYDKDRLVEQTEISSEEMLLMDKLIIDMISLKSDQLNQMWSYLGSKYMPSVLYTMRLVRIQNEAITSESIVKHVKIQLWENDKNDIAGEIESGDVPDDQIKDLDVNKE